jgi:dolichyl-phosphate beta-glucosyltransferase
MLSIVIPAYNEEKRIEDSLKKLINHFSKKKFDYEIIVSEDGSTDRTCKIVKSFMKKNKRVKLLHSKTRQGKGGGVIKGFKESTGDILIFTDVDLACPASEFDKLIDEINHGSDVAIAARRLEGSKIIVERSLLKKIASKGFNILVNFLFNFGTKDTQCGLKAIKKEALNKILSKLTLKGWAFDIELLLRARQNNLKITEVPVVWSRKEKTKFSFFKNSFEMGIDVLGLWFKEKFNRFNLAFTLILISFFLSCLFLFGSTPIADEGTHNLIALFFYDFVNYFLTNPTFSFNKIYNYAISYLINYPKLSLYYPPLFHVFLSFMYRIFGISFFTGSLSSLLFSSATLIFVFKFSKNYLKSSEIGLISSIFFVICPIIIYLSIKAMTDIPVFFFFFISIYLYLLAINTNKTKYFIISSVFSTLGLLTKWNVALIFPIIFCYSLFENKKTIKKLILSFILVVMLLSPYLYLSYKAGLLFLPLKTSMITAGYTEKDPQYTSLEGWLYYPVTLSNNYFTLPIFILSLFSLVYYLKKKQKYWKLFLIWFLVTYLFFTWLPNKDPRYILPIWPSLIFPLATLLKSMNIKLKFVALILIIILLLNVNYFYLQPTFRHKTGFNSVIDKVIEKDGNILLASETSWFYSSSFMFELASKEGRFVRKVFRPCVLDNFDLKDLLDNQGIRYVIITDPIREQHKQSIQKINQLSQLQYLSGIIDKETKVFIYENIDYKPSDSKCNYICISNEWVCQNTTKLMS